MLFNSKDDRIDYYKKLESRYDIEKLKEGMFIYKIHGQGQSDSLSLHLNNYQKLKIISITEDYLVLLQINSTTESTFLAKDFDRLIADNKWWLPIYID